GVTTPASDTSNIPAAQSTHASRTVRSAHRFSPPDVMAVASAANAAVSAAYRSLQRQYLEHEKLAALATAMTSGGENLCALR
ncbi:hypothetical protein C6A85_10720, partial [Mycobacterium sp. ITM-2017-0098]